MRGNIDSVALGQFFLVAEGAHVAELVVKDKQGRTCSSTSEMKLNTGYRPGFFSPGNGHRGHKKPSRTVFGDLGQSVAKAMGESKREFLSCRELPPFY